ncbi:hypothetical protein [Xanthomonas arboricola]
MPIGKKDPCPANGRGLYEGGFLSLPPLILKPVWTEVSTIFFEGESYLDGDYKLLSEPAAAATSVVSLRTGAAAVCFRIRASAFSRAEVVGFGLLRQILLFVFIARCLKFIDPLARADNFAFERPSKSLALGANRK